MAVDEFDVNGDGKGKKMSPTEKSDNMNLQTKKKTYQSQKKKHIPIKSEQTIQISIYIRYMKTETTLKGIRPFYPL